MLSPIAIIGIGCRFPGASGPREFWELLDSGRTAVGPVPPGRWDAEAYCGPDPAGGKMPTNLGGFLQGIDRFDAGFFGLSPEEACATDPQQRLLLEVAWEAMEDAGIVPRQLAGSDAGVFVGVSSLNYGSLAQLKPEAINRFTNTGAGGTICANRVSYFFDLRGPSFAVDAACASSLLALHLACQTLWSGQAKLALAGGVNAILLPGPGVGMARGGMMAADGVARVFDADARGWVRGEGAGVVLLKPLDRAAADGDPVYAVIRGGAVNQNGRSNGLSGPSRPAQEAVLREAYARAGVSPGAVQYVEAHSNATPVGDAVELAALGNALQENRPADRPCAVGSLKANIGHLEAAAGIASVIKVALMIKHRRLVPLLHLHRPNPHANLDRLPLRIQTESAPWPDQAGGRLAGVSAAGYGGANVHVVLGEPPQPDESPAGPLHRHDTRATGASVLFLSAKTARGLGELANRYADWLGQDPAPNLADVCHTARFGRTPMAHRLAVTASDPAELKRKLERFARGESEAGVFAGQVKRGSAIPAGPADDDGPEQAARAFVGGSEPAACCECPPGRRIHGLPTYPFERERYWMDGTEVPSPAAIKPSLPSQSPDRVGDRPAVLRAPLPPRNELEKKLVRIWEQTLNVSPVGVRDSFFELGGTSAMALQLFAGVEKEFAKVLPLASLYSAQTVEKLARLLGDPTGRAGWDALVPLNETGTRPPLFFVPGLGGHAFDLRTLAGRLGEDQPVYVLHPQGLDPGQVPLTRVPDMARAFVGHIRGVQPHGPYRLAGYSFGGSVAFEMACQLESAGEPLALVSLLDAYAPAAFRRRSLPYRIWAHARLLCRLSGADRRKYLKGRMDNVWRRLHVAALGGPAEASPATTSKIVDAVQRVTDANAVAWQSYRPGRYSGKVTLFRAEPDDAMVREFCLLDHCNGWACHAAGGVEVIPMPCEHLKLFHGPSLEFLAGQLKLQLDRAANAAPTHHDSRRVA